MTKAEMKRFCTQTPLKAAERMWAMRRELDEVRAGGAPVFWAVRNMTDGTWEGRPFDPSEAQQYINDRVLEQVEAVGTADQFTAYPVYIRP